MPGTMQNCKISRANTSGFRGVHFYKCRQRWSAQITLRKRRFHLGYFDTAREAGAAYDQAAIDFYGQFARTNFHIPGFQCLQDQPPETLPRATKARILNGEKHPRAKLSSRQVRAIRYAFRSATDRALAKMFGVSAGAMSHIRTGKSYR
jgi:hypothetical protein